MLFLQKCSRIVGYPGGYKWNTLFISRLLSLFNFYFTSSFMNTCIRDCVKQNTIGPLILAFYVLESNFKSSNVNQAEIFSIVAQFQAFKKSLIKNRYLNKKFFLNLVFEEKNIKKFYGSNIKIILKQSAGISIVLVSGALLGSLFKLIF